MASVGRGHKPYKGATKRRGGGTREGKGSEQGHRRSQLRQTEARARGSRGVGDGVTRVGEMGDSRGIMGEGRQTGRGLMSV